MNRQDVGTFNAKFLTGPVRSRTGIRILMSTEKSSVRGGVMFESCMVVALIAVTVITAVSEVGRLVNTHFIAAAEAVSGESLDESIGGGSGEDPTGPPKKPTP